MKLNKENKIRLLQAVELLNMPEKKQEIKETDLKQARITIRQILDGLEKEKEK